MKRACVLLFLLFSLPPLCSAQKVEKLPAFSAEAPGKVKATLDATGYRVFLPNTLAACDVWLAKDIPTAKRADAKGASYPEFADSQFLGEIFFPKGGGHDFRGQTVRAGTTPCAINYCRVMAIISASLHIRTSSCLYLSLTILTQRSTMT